MQRKKASCVFIFLPAVFLLSVSCTLIYARQSLFITIVSACISVLTALSLFACLRMLRSNSALLQDLTGTLTRTAANLSHGLSEFSSGDMRGHLEAPVSGSRTTEAEALERLLLSCLDDFNSLTAVPLKRVCFVGANSYQEGQVAGEHIAKLLSGKGKIVFLIPQYTQVNHLLRMKGCRDYLLEKYPEIVSAGVFETEGNLSIAAKITQKCLDEIKDLDLIYVTDGYTPSEISKVVSAFTVRKVKLFIYDATPENIALLKNGTVTALIEQNPYMQTYNALINLYNSRETSWTPPSPKLFMQPIYIDLSNYRTYWNDEKNKRVTQGEERTLFSVPAPKKSEKQYRFGVIMPEKTGFFASLVAGAEAAADVLKKFDVEVEIISVFHTQADFGSAALYVPAIESFVQRGFDGIATGIIDPGVMPAVNKAAEKGLTITTFSTEPFSLREIIATIISNIARLADSSQDIAASAEESARANTQIGTSIFGIKNGIDEQKNRVAANETELNTLNKMISEMQESIASYASLVGKMTDESSHGASAMDETLHETKDLKAAINDIHTELSSFNEKLGTVQKFAEVIENLAENTNVLAINASIEASRAGENGKAFGVVAGEVRTLAESSRHTAENIRDTVKNITESMAHIMKTSRSGTEKVDKNLSQTADTQKVFESITAGLMKSNDTIEHIKTSVSGIVASGSGVKANMNVIENMSNTMASRLDEIASSISELQQQGNNLSKMANDLRGMAVNQNLVFSQLSVN